MECQKTNGVNGYGPYEFEKTDSSTIQKIVNISQKCLEKWLDTPKIRLLSVTGSIELSYSYAYLSDSIFADEMRELFRKRMKGRFYGR